LNQQRLDINSPATSPILIDIPTPAPSERLDRWLAAQLPEHSRSAIQRWIADGLVLVDGQTAKASRKVEAGQRVVVHIPPPAETEIRAVDIPLSIVYEDDDLLVVDKPAGLVVHPAPGHSDGTLVNAVLHHCPEIAGVGGEKRPGIVHRLDKETSGLIVVAKNDATHHFLQRQFAARTVEKEYLALLEGRIDPPKGRITASIGRHPVERKRQAVLPIEAQTGKNAGREAITEYETIAVYHTRLVSGLSAHFSLIRANLHTGRTHQIRVHCAWMKHPVVGDTLYGHKRQRLSLNRHFLHAHKLRFRLPSGEEREFVTPLPDTLQRLLDKINGEGER
jgi:23S rRNA pseudouridine1911/1915/1917 synthase